MVDDNGVRAPLRLCALAWIVDDERVEEWNVRQRNVGITAVRQCKRFAR